jgi:hydroxylamine reductase (hybrid-cluster protein)
MTYFISGAIILSTAYNANQARKSRQQAENDQRTLLAQQSADQAAMRTELAKQTAEYAKQGASLEQQAQTARQQFEQSQLNYQTNKLEMERKAKEVQDAADEERRKAASAEASALRARTRGGRRSLLSDQRMDAELGVQMDLGSSGMRIQ